jgi:hypothetical protein
MDNKRNDFLDFVATPKEILEMIERECATVSDRRQRLRDWMARNDALKKQYDGFIEERKTNPKMGTFDTTIEDLEVASKVLGLYYSELQEEYDKCIFRPQGDHFQIFFNDHDYGLIDKKKGLYDIHCLLQRPNQEIDATFLYCRENMEPVSQEELKAYEMEKNQYKTQMSNQFISDRKTLKQVKERRARIKDKIDRCAHDPDDLPNMVLELEQLDKYIKEAEIPKGKLTKEKLTEEKLTKFRDQNVETARTGVYKRIKDIYRLLEKHESEYEERNGVNPGLSVYLTETIDFGYTLTYNPSKSEPFPLNWLT